MSDINGRTDIMKLVDAFYVTVRKDEMLGYIFDEIAKVDWDKHLSKMYDFWEHILFDTGNYRGQPFMPHWIINEKVKLTPEHFKRWFALFEETVDTQFEGANASAIKIKAHTIKEVWSFKIDHFNKHQIQNT